MVISCHFSVVLVFLKWLLGAWQQYWSSFGRGLWKGNERVQGVILINDDSEVYMGGMDQKYPKMIAQIPL